MRELLIKITEDTIHIQGPEPFVVGAIIEIIHAVEEQHPGTVEKVITILTEAKVC